MGTDAQIVITGGRDAARRDALLLSARSAVERCERRWSRFVPDSDVSRINGSAGRWVRVDPETFRLLEAAVAAWELTAGRFDPTVLPALLAAGYDRSFERLGEHVQPPAVAPVIAGGAAIDFDEHQWRVRVPIGVGVDLGGIAKGFTADAVAEQLVAGGAEGALVNLGGDVRLAGVPPVAEGWRIACSHPMDGSVNAIVAVGSGAVVTSTRSRRRWTVDTDERHHLIDPETGRPADTGLMSVTVVASHAMWGEVVAKAVFVAGAEPGADLIARTGATGTMVTDDGEVVHLPGMEAFLAA